MTHTPSRRLGDARSWSKRVIASLLKALPAAAVLVTIGAFGSRTADGPHFLVVAGGMLLLLVLSVAFFELIVGPDRREDPQRYLIAWAVAGTFLGILIAISALVTGGPPGEARLAFVVFPLFGLVGGLWYGNRAL